MNTVTKEITLTLDQWEKLKDALGFYEFTASEFMTLSNVHTFRKEYIIPIYEQMPEEVF